MKSVFLILLVVAAKAQAGTIGVATGVDPEAPPPPPVRYFNVPAQGEPAVTPVAGWPIPSDQTQEQAGASQKQSKPQVSATGLRTPANACPGADAIFLPTGFSFRALLPDAIYSYNAAAPVMAVLEEDVKFRDKVVFPRATRLVGSAGTLHTFDRVNISWNLAVLPEGCEFGISAIALDADDGSAGIKGKLEKHEDAVAAQIGLKSMLTAASAGAAAVVPGASMEGALATNIMNEANQNVDQNISDIKNQKSIYVRERTPVRVFVLSRFTRASLGR